MDNTIERPKRPRLKKMITLEASDAWKAWFAGLADHAGLSQASLIDQAARRFAVEHGYTEKPPKR